MEFPTTTAALAAVLIIVSQILMLGVGLHRNRLGVGVGTGGDADLERKIRRHGNLTENAAIFVVALALLEMSGSPRWVATLLAGLFLVGRTLHILAFSSLTGSHMKQDGNKAFIALRGAGAFLTLFCGLAVGAALIFFISTGTM